MKFLFVEYPKCSTCQKAKKWLDESGISYEDRHIVEEDVYKRQVIGGTFGDVVHHKESLRCAQNIANECIRVADAAGIHMEKMQGFSLDKLLRFQSGFKRTLLVPVYKVLVKPHRLLRASMLQDLEKGKPCEIDSINGVVCAMGKKYGVKTPFNDKVVEIIKGIEDGKYTYQYKNVEQFRPLF